MSQELPKIHYETFQAINQIQKRKQVTQAEADQAKKQLRSSVGTHPDLNFYAVCVGSITLKTDDCEKEVMSMTGMEKEVVHQAILYNIQKRKELICQMFKRMPNDGENEQIESIANGSLSNSQKIKEILTVLTCVVDGTFLYKIRGMPFFEKK